MKLILVTCPHCGARLNIAEAMDQITCEYCGAPARLQRRTRMLERVLPPPPAPPGAPAMPIAVQQRTRRLGVMILAGTAIPVAISTVMVAGLITDPGPPSRPRAPAAKPGAAAATREAPSWQGTDGLIAVDLNHDGVPDLVGRTRRVRDGDEIRIAALDGKTGALRWESESLGTYSDTYRGPLALAGELVVFASQRAEVRAFAVADGAPRWRATLPERTEAFCDRGETIVAVGTDEVERPLARATGAPAGTTPEAAPATGRPKRAAKPRCTAAPTDGNTRRSVHLDFATADRLELSGDRIVSGPAGRVASGTRPKGTRVPVVVALDAQGKPRWRAEVPVDPLSASERAASVAVGETAVCAVYATEARPQAAHATCFAAADGRRMWDAVLASSAMSSIHVVGDTLYVSAYGAIAAHELATGAVRWSFGR